MRKILAMLALSLVTTLAQASAVTLTDFELKWGATDQFGGPVTITDLNGEVSPFQVTVTQFPEAFETEGLGKIGFIIPLLGSGVTFESVELYGVLGKLREQLDTTIGTGFANDNGALFDDRVQFFANYGGNWTLDDSRITSAVPEPATSMLLLMGLIGLTIAQKNRRIAAPVRYAS